MKFFDQRLLRRAQSHCQHVAQHTFLSGKGAALQGRAFRGSRKLDEPEDWKLSLGTSHSCPLSAVGSASVS